MIYTRLRDDKRGTALRKARRCEDHTANRKPETLINLVALRAAVVGCSYEQINECRPDLDVREVQS